MDVWMGTCLITMGLTKWIFFFFLNFSFFFFLKKKKEKKKKKKTSNEPARTFQKMERPIAS